MLESRKGPTVAVLALVAIAIVAIWLLRGDAHAVEPAPREPADVTPSVAPATGTLIAETPVADREAAEPSPPTPGVVDDRAHVRGRCVDERGQPLAGCTATFRGRAGNRTRMALQGDVPWQNPEPLATGDDGVFDFAFEPPSGLQYSLTVQGEGRVPRTGRWGRIEPGQILDLGDIEFVRGFEVRGRVVDERGAPVAKVGVNLRDLPLPIADDMAANDTRHGWSDDDGYFTVRVPIPAGTFPLAVSARGTQLVAPNQVKVAAVGEPVIVTVRRMPAISGIVVDELGQPVQGAEIQAVTKRPPSRASREDGTFTIYARTADPTPVRLTVSDPGPCEAPDEDPTIYDWGTTNVRIVLRRALSLELEVIDRATREPVTRFAVQCFHRSAGQFQRRGPRLSGEHENGRVIIDGVRRGPNLLRVVPLDRAFACSEPVEFEAPDGGIAPIRVEIERLLQAVVRVESADGVPFVGSTVEVVTKDDTTFSAQSHINDRGASPPAAAGQLNSPELVSQSVTTADGTAAVLVPRIQDRLVVCVRGAHRTMIVDPARFLPGQPLVVVPPASGTIVGTVQCSKLDPTKLSLTHQRVDKPARRSDEFEVQADGTFAMRHLAPGRYRLALRRQNRYQLANGGSSGGSIELDVRIPEVTVEANRETRADIDVRAIVPGTVRGRLSVNGTPPAAARIDFQRDPGWRFGQFMVMADGSFEATGLLAGTYRAAVILGDFNASQGTRIPHDEEFVLTAGQDLAREFHFTHRRLVVTLHDATGAPPKKPMQCYCRTGRKGWRARTDTDGRLVFDPAPTGTIEIMPVGTKIRLEAAMPANQTSHEMTLTLPEAGQ